jgi:pimeloyl-ACP methyl ester carboxylesterase
MARDLIQLIDTMALPQIDLLGFSMGAVVALLAATTDQRIRRLAIVGVGAGVVELGAVDRRVLPPDALAAAPVADDPTAIEIPAAATFRTNAEARAQTWWPWRPRPGDPRHGHPLHRITAPTPGPRWGRRSVRGAPGDPCFRNPKGAAQDPGRRPRHRDHQSPVRRMRHRLHGGRLSRDVKDRRTTDHRFRPLP